jgi:2-iminobutanoate/2-iminopropanoate deaminase
MRNRAETMSRRVLLAASSAALLPTSSVAGGTQLKSRPINPTDSSYAQAHEVPASARVLYISGQIPEAEDDSVPKDFRAQCRLTWANIEKQLKAADMTLQNLVKITVFLSDRKYRRENYEVRAEVLGKTVSPAMTIIITGIYDEAWLLEIEAIAAA